MCICSTVCFFPPPFIFISWRLITLQYCSGFAVYSHESAMDLHVFPIPPTSVSTRSPWVFPVRKVQALVSCIQSGLAICFTVHIIHVLMLFSRNIPPSPPTESKSLSVHLCLFFCFAYRVIITIFLNSIYMH